MIKWKAVNYMILSAMSFALMDISLKYTSRYPAFELVFFRSIASVAMASGYLWYHRISFWGNQRRLLLVRSLIGLASMSLFFASTKYLPLATAVSLRYLAPIFAAFFAVWLLREKILGKQWFYFTIAFIGVVLLKGFDPRVSITGMVLILFSAMFTGMVFILIRRIGTRDHPVVIVNYFMTITLLVGGFFAAFDWVQPVGKDWLILLSMGVTGFFGQLFMTKGFQIEETNKIAPIKYLEVVFVLILAYIWFGEGYRWLALVGMALIIAGLTLNVLARRTDK